MAQIGFRFGKSSLVRSLKLSLLASLFILIQTPQLLLASGIPQRWEAKKYRPPAGIGAPQRVEGGGTRGSDRCLAGKALTALVPSNRFGATVAAYPTFFVYMPAVSPQNPSLPVEFILEDADENELYKATFQTTGRPGIVTLSLPTGAGLSPLQVGRDYKWSFSIICQPGESTENIEVGGWVRRVELNPTLNTQLKQASLQRQVELYAEAEIWQDALATLVQLRRNNPSDPAVAAEWAKLLSAAGLENLTQELLPPMPSTLRGRLTSSQP